MPLESMLAARGNAHLSAKSCCQFRGSRTESLPEVSTGGATRPGRTTSRLHQASRLQQADATRSCDLHVSSVATSSRSCIVATCAANQDVPSPANGLNSADSTAGSDRLASGNPAECADSVTQRSATQLLDAQRRIKQKQEEDQGRQPYSLIATQVAPPRSPATQLEVACTLVLRATRALHTPALNRLHHLF